MRTARREPRRGVAPPAPARAGEPGDDPLEGGGRRTTRRCWSSARTAGRSATPCAPSPARRPRMPRWRRPTRVPATDRLRPVDVASVIEGVLAGDRRAVARAISMVEDGAADLEALSAGIYASTGRASTIGLTGAPGVGKSTPRDRAGPRRARSAGAPSRSSRSTPRRRTRAERSWAIASGCRSTRPTPASSSARWPRAGTWAAWRSPRPRRSGCWTRPATTRSSSRPSGWARRRSRSRPRPTRAVVVLSPGAGDAVQMAKAGILEIADVFVVNKDDKDGAGDVDPRAPADAAPGRGSRVGPADRADVGAPARGHRGAQGRVRRASGVPGRVGRAGRQAPRAAPAGGGEPRGGAVPREGGGRARRRTVRSPTDWSRGGSTRIGPRLC